MKSKNALTFSIRKKRKINKIKENIELKLDYKNIDKRDVYGFYLTNKTMKSKNNSLPIIGNFVQIYPDFIALENEVKLYNYTDNVCISRFKDDSLFDCIDGLYNAIIYKDIELLKYYKERYKYVKFFVAPDYSLYGDFDEIVIKNNLRKSIIVYLRLTFELDAIVFPLMTYYDEESLNRCFDHIMKGSNIAISLKGIMNNKEKNLFLKALKKAIDIISPKSILVYTVGSIKNSKEFLSYAYDMNVPVYFVDNTLFKRNSRRYN